MADKKVQLNDEQWSALQALQEANARRYPTGSIKVSNRLRSNGFVEMDRLGGKLLTDQGLHRLQQGSLFRRSCSRPRPLKASLAGLGTVRRRGEAKAELSRTDPSATFSNGHGEGRLSGELGVVDVRPVLARKRLAADCSLSLVSTAHRTSRAFASRSSVASCQFFSATNDSGSQTAP